MNFYDKVYELVRCFKETEEYKTYMELKEEIKKDDTCSALAHKSDYGTFYSDCRRI